MSRRRLPVLIVGVIAGAGIAVAVSTEWLWFREVRYADVFLAMLGLRASVGLAAAGTVFVFVAMNVAWLARRAAALDVLWEIDQRPLPGLVMPESVLSQGLVPAIAVLSIVAGLAASARWETMLRFIYRLPFGSTDPLFGHDVSFFVFELPFWRLLASWGVRLVTATTALVVLLHVVRRSLVVTGRGPRLARSARTHLLWLLGLFLFLQGIEFWLDRFELVYSRRGFLFGAGYADVHAALPILSGLATLCLCAAALCLVQIGLRGVRLVAGGMAVVVLAWVVGLGLYPALVQRLQVTPNELAAEWPFIERHIRMTREDEPPVVTTTDRYPYADPTPGVGNYIRNSVKVTVDAYHGTVDFYLAEAADPLARALARAFPTLIKPLDAMPGDLRGHIRYPEDLFAVQAAKYATYHMRDPQVFYNKEDLWTIPERSADGRRESMEPYYTIMRLLGERREEFILLVLFNPARRDNMIAWMAARSDAPEYGRVLVYKFPKQRLVYGPRQIDARINQDPVIARQLALWNQSGSTVIRGSLLAIPIEDGLIYVQPLYLAATAPGTLPELRRIIVAHGNEIAMEPTLERALASLFQTESAGPVRSPDRPATQEPATGPATALPALGRQALEIWISAQDALRRGDLAQYGAEQKRLEEALRALLEATR